jgi:hydrogenase expression/formation protein HypC
MTSCHDSHCITCSDEAVALRIVEVDVDAGLARCEDGSIVEIALVEPVSLNDVVLVHAGTAIGRDS